MHPLIQAARPRQWVKNLVVFAPVVFSARFWIFEDLARTGITFIALCLLSSALYIVNDIRDRVEDREHPTKKMRAIASGRVSVSVARIAALLLFACGMGAVFLLGPVTLLATLGFIAINILYTGVGKHIAILDVMLIGASFVARVFVGAAAILVPVSAWLFLTLFFLASYLGFTKRTAELRLGTTHSRKVLDGYTPLFLDHARSATLAMTLALYTLYTFASPFGQLMALTVPFVFFGLLRYQAIVDTDTGANDGPSDHVYKDRQLQMAILFWCISVGAVVVIHSI